MSATLRPLLRAEFRHQRFVIQRGRVGLLWILLAAALLIPAMLSALHFMHLVLVPPADIAELVGALGLTDTSQSWHLLLIVGVLPMYVVVTAITYGLSGNSITREKRGRTWDNLRLTGVGGWNIVFGKWLASLRAVLGDHMMSIMLRLGLVSYGLLVLNVLQATGRAVPLGAVMIAWLLTVGFGLLDAGLTAALGLLAAVQEGALGAIVGLLLGAVRLLAAAFAAGWTYVVLQALVTDSVALPALILAAVLVYSLAMVGALLAAHQHVR